MKFTLRPGELSLSDIPILLDAKTKLELHSDCFANIEASYNVVKDIVASGKTVYGINTGFGSLANTRIDKNDLALLQRSIVLSHAAGTGKLFADEIVRLILILKINSLALGFSGVRRTTIDTLIKLFNGNIYPCIPSKGSVGASGDLAPLAHLSMTLLGEGDVRYEGIIIAAAKALKHADIKPIVLEPKEGLALLNGTQVSTALVLHAILQTNKIFNAALITGALSVEAVAGSRKAFDARIQEVRRHQGQITVAAKLRELLANSKIADSHQNCPKVQDPYSLRCQPQVMGACLSHIEFATKTIMNEANAVSDNPLVFAEQSEIISGGNFHAEPVAMAADTLALAIAEIGALSERRIALLIDPNFSGLPPFLVNNSGVNSGFMIAQVTAAALASENKSLAHPASVDSLPTSANQEDHVSMATFAGRRLLEMNDNTCGIVAIELLAACQGIDLRRPLTTSDTLENVVKIVREQIPFYDQDRFFAPDIQKAKEIVNFKL